MPDSGLGLSLNGVEGWLRLSDEFDARRRCDRNGESEERRDMGDAAEEPAVDGSSEDTSR